MNKKADRSVDDAVGRKLRRLKRAKRSRDNTWRYAAQVGALSWVFVTPVLGAGWLAHWTLKGTQRQWLALPILTLGVWVGGALVHKRIRQLLQEAQRDDD